MFIKSNIHNKKRENTKATEAAAGSFFNRLQIDFNLQVFFTNNIGNSLWAASLCEPLVSRVFPLLDLMFPPLLPTCHLANYNSLRDLDLNDTPSERPSQICPSHLAPLQISFLSGYFFMVLSRVCCLYVHLISSFLYGTLGFLRAETLYARRAQILLCHGYNAAFRHGLLGYNPNSTMH